MKVSTSKQTTSSSKSKSNVQNSVKKTPVVSVKKNNTPIVSKPAPKLNYIPPEYEFKFDIALYGFEKVLADYYQSKNGGKLLDYTKNGKTEVGSIFELYVMDLLKFNGYSRIKLRGRRGDGGQDIYCEKEPNTCWDDTECFTVQCKFHGDGKSAGAPDIQSAFSGIGEDSCINNVMLITTAAKINSTAEPDFKKKRKYLNDNDGDFYFIGAKKLASMIAKARENGFKY